MNGMCVCVCMASEFRQTRIAKDEQSAYISIVSRRPSYYWRPSILLLCYFTGLIIMGARRIFSRGGQIRRRSQDVLWGCTFFLKKVHGLFSVLALKTQAKTTKWTTSTDSPSINCGNNAEIIGLLSVWLQLLMHKTLYNISGRWGACPCLQAPLPII